MVYQYAVDSIGSSFVDVFSTLSNAIVEWRPFINIGPPTERKIPHGGKRGKLLISYLYPGPTSADRHYQVIDLQTGNPSSPISFPWRSEATLTSDANYVVIEEVSVSLSPLGNRRYRPGNVYVFETSTGKLRQKLTLPPDGVVMLFDTYPDKFFYFNKLTRQSLSGDVTTITPTNVLLDTLISLKHQVFSKGWLGDQKFMQELDRDLQNARTRLAKRDSIGCAQELETFQQEVRKEYLAKPKKNDKRFVTEDAYKLLCFNAQYVIERVITLPPRPYAPLVDQLTSLRAQIRSDAQQGFLGGEILLKGLEIMVDGAKQRLQRRDSVGTALYVSFFQQTVRQTYELTKGRPIGKIYVKPEGYISLYYRAGYILEKLPEPLGQFMPKMEPELEQELQRYQRQVEQQR
jgi:hypothetical protein